MTASSAGRRSDDRMGGVPSPSVTTGSRRAHLLMACLLLSLGLVAAPSSAWALGDLGPISPTRVAPSFDALWESRPSSYGDRSRTGTKCHVWQNERRRAAFCLYGKRRGYTRTVAMIGDSHVAQWLAPMEVIAERRGWRILYMTASSCDFGLPATHRSYRSCQGIFAKMIDGVRAARPDFVLMRANRRKASRPERTRIAFWQRITATGTPILAFRDNPTFRYRPSECVQRNLRRPMACAGTRNRLLARTFTRGDAPAGARIFDLTSRYCDATRCPAVIGGVLVYRDKHHFTRNFALRMTGALDQALMAGWNDPGRSRVNEAAVTRLVRGSR